MLRHLSRNINASARTVLSQRKIAHWYSSSTTSAEELLFTTSFLQRVWEPRKWKMYWNNKFGLQFLCVLFCSVHTSSNEEIRWREGAGLALFPIYKREPFGNPPAARIKAERRWARISNFPAHWTPFENIFSAHWAPIFQHYTVFWEQCRRGKQRQKWVDDKMVQRAQQILIFMAHSAVHAERNSTLPFCFNIPSVKPLNEVYESICVQAALWCYFGT
jgi:hypothetical protein